MNLSEIVQYLNHLDTLSVYRSADHAHREITKITHIVQHNPIQIGDHAAKLATIQRTMETALQQYQQELTELYDSVQQLIEHTEPGYFAASTENYQQGMRSDTPAYILSRTRSVEADTEKLLMDRLARYTDWRYPGMVIRPAHCVGIQSLVALDPLYLVDTHQDLLTPLKSQFTAEYQRRLRYYVIEEYTDHKIFWNLPQEQFGFVYAWRYFDFKPWEVLQQYLDEIFLLLRPGGSFLFSFNNCDDWRAVGLAEHYFCCYTPGRLVREYAKKTGYQITYDYCDEAGTAWLELCKPGTLDSIRGAQALAGIFQKVDPVPETVDKSVKQLYNEMDLDMLIELAGVLNVDISADKTKHEFNIKKVRRTISAHLETENYPEETLRQLFKPKENQ